MAQIRVGILALQGDVAEHAAALDRAGAVPVEVKRPQQLVSVDGLIVPGGESTTVVRLLERAGLNPAARRPRPARNAVVGTCMGMIVAAREVVGIDQPTLSLLDVAVRRNAFGRQNDSVQVALSIPVLGSEPFPAVFIRAPWIERSGPGVEVLAERDGHGVMAAPRQRARNVVSSGINRRHARAPLFRFDGRQARRRREESKRGVRACLKMTPDPASEERAQGSFEGQIPAVEPLLTEVVVTLALAAHRVPYKRAGRQARLWRCGNRYRRRCRSIRAGQGTANPRPAIGDNANACRDAHDVRPQTRRVRPIE